MTAEPTGSILHSAINRRTTLEVEEAREDHNFPPLHLTSELSTSLLSMHGVQPEAEPNRPLLLVKLTGYRLLTTAIIVTFGTVKAMASLKGAAVTATALEWVIGVVLGTILYWLGLYENVKPPVAMWFFHEDYILELFYIPCAGVIAAIFALSVALILNITIATPISLILVGTKLFPDEDWTGLLLRPLVFIVMYCLLLIAASFMVPLFLKYTSSFIGRSVLRLGGHRLKASTRVAVDGYLDRYRKHPSLYTWVILIVGLYMLFTLFSLMVDSTLSIIIN